MPYLTHTKIAHLAQKDNTPQKNSAPAGKTSATLHLPWAAAATTTDKNEKVFRIFQRKSCTVEKLIVTLHSKIAAINGAVVQLVRIHACHAWGRGFESRPHRNKHWKSMFYKINTRFYFDVKPGVFVFFKSESVIRLYYIV